MIRRPDSLQEVAVESTAYGEFGRNLRDFLHEFAQALRCQSPLTPLLEAEPPRLAGRFAEGKICDAFLAATADHLACLQGIPVPAWALADERKLRRPWFASPLAALRAVLILESPAAFRSRNLFVSENALTRA